MAGEFGIGQPVARFEDARFLRGEGRYLHDVVAPSMVHLVLVRSPHAHAQIRSIDTSAARGALGVLGVYTVDDLERDSLGTTVVTLPRKRPDGSPMFWQAHPGLARDRVRYVGDPLVAVVAQTLGEAKDAAELVGVEYEPLPSVTDTAQAAQPGAPRVWEQIPDNVCNVFEVGDRAAVEKAFAAAATVVKGRYVVSRVHAQYLEPRGALGAWDPSQERYTLEADTQGPHRVREMLARQVFRIPEHRLRVVAHDVGGAFGIKNAPYVEHRLVLWLAKKLGRPVKWTCERSEAPLADAHGRDCVSEAELALDADHRFLALRVRNTSNLGAYVSADNNLLPTFANLGSLVGMYRLPAAHVEVAGVFSNAGPVSAYRGAGRPEAIYAIERLVDDAARALGVDRAELRRRNLVPASAMPYRTALTFTYDCGEFERGFDQALAMADWKGFPARRAAARARGRLRGIGVANAIERAGAPPGMEYAEIRFEPGGTATALAGSKNQGQGHETLYRQLLCDRLGLAPGDLRVADGDTDAVAFGTGTFGSRTVVMGGSAMWLAAGKVIEKGKRIAAHLLEAGEADIAFESGRFSVAGTDRGVGLKEVVRAAFSPGLPAELEPGLFEHAAFAPPAATFPNGTHVCEVEVDPETGAVELCGYWVVDDVGTEINPLTLKGQVVGGVVQGLGQALMERIVYERESGQLLTASFMDYAMPRAADLCNFDVGSNPVPTKLNPLGAKGAGEAGTVGALPVAICAVLDALAPLGVKDLEMPATPERVWRAIQEAKGNP